jgi:hypothetical protein
MDDYQCRSSRQVNEWPFRLFVFGLFAVVAAKALLERAL